jgi:hypothetical protein
MSRPLQETTEFFWNRSIGDIVRNQTPGWITGDFCAGTGRTARENGVSHATEA